MKVEKVNFTTYNNSPKLRVTNGIRKNETIGDTTSFTGVPNGEIVKDIQKLMPRSINMMTKFADNMGEISNILINAAGTGLVAPIFIKYNPFSKTDEDTRTYSAWRQPLSAVLAIGTQATMVAPFNNLLSWMSNSGACEDFYNKTNFQDADYIKKLIKKTNKGLTKEQLDDLVSKEQKKQYNELIENLRNKNTIYIKHYDTATTAMDADSLKNLQLETLEQMLKDDNQKLKTCNTKSEKRAIRSAYLTRQNDTAKALLNEIDTEFKTLSTPSEYAKYLGDKIDKLKNSKADNELIEMVKEIRDRGTAKTTKETAGAIMTEMQNKVTKMLSHVDTYSKKLSEEEILKHVEQSVKDRKDALNASIELIKEIKTDLNAGASIKEIEDKIEGYLKKNPIKEDCSIKAKYAEKIAEKFKNNIEGSLKSSKQVTGLVISLLVLPVTCYLLNYIYPIFMDAVFPNLSNKKHDNEASALVAKAPKKEEV